MSIEIRVPQLPESVADATLVGLAQATRSDACSRDENLADLETDKVVLEVPAPVTGVLREIKVQAGTTVKSGELLARDRGGRRGATSAPHAAGHRRAVDRRDRSAARTAAPRLRPRPGRRRGASSRSASSRRTAARRAEWSASASRRPQAAAAAQTTTVGRSAKRRRPLQRRCRALRPRRLPLAAPASSTGAPPATAPRRRAEQRVPMTRLRARIAERMVQAQATQALLTTFNEVDLQRGEGAARALQGQLREAARREARLHVVLRQGGDRGAASDFRSSTPRSTATTSSITSTSTSASRSPPSAG